MISINPYEIILQIINFGILYVLLRKFLAKPLAALLSNRANMIKHNIENAEINKRKADELLAEKKEALKSAQVEAQNIRKKAEKAAENELAAIIQSGQESTQKMLDQAKKDIDIQANNARKELLKDVSDLAVKVVSKFVTTELSDTDKKASMDQLVNKVSNG
jgi:F-type H+-transporting ATPase subunit b